MPCFLRPQSPENRVLTGPFCGASRRGLPLGRRRPGEGTPGSSGRLTTWALGNTQQEAGTQPASPCGQDSVSPPVRGRSWVVPKGGAAPMGVRGEHTHKGLLAGGPGWRLTGAVPLARPCRRDPAVLGTHGVSGNVPGGPVGSGDIHSLLGAATLPIGSPCPRPGVGTLLGRLPEGLKAAARPGCKATRCS